MLPARHIHIPLGGVRKAGAASQPVGKSPPLTTSAWPPASGLLLGLPSGRDFGASLKARRDKLFSVQVAFSHGVCSQDYKV